MKNSITDRWLSSASKRREIIRSADSHSVWSRKQNDQGQRRQGEKALPGLDRHVGSSAQGSGRSWPHRTRSFLATLRRLLKYWHGPRCGRIWRWPRRERSADIHAIPGQRQIRRHLRARVGKGGWPLHPLVAAHSRDVPRSFLAIHPFVLYARATPVFQQSFRPSGEPSMSALARRFAHASHRYRRSPGFHMTKIVQPTAACVLARRG